MRRIPWLALAAALSLAAPGAAQERPDFYNFEQPSQSYPTPGTFGMPPGTPSSPPQNGQPLPAPRIRMTVPNSGWPRGLVGKMRSSLGVVTQVVPMDQSGDYTIIFFWQERRSGTGANVQLILVDACNGRWCFTGANTYSCADDSTACANAMTSFVLDLIRKQRGL